MEEQTLYDELVNGLREIEKNVITDLNAGQASGSWMGRIVSNEAPANYLNVQITEIQRTGMISVQADTVVKNKIVGIQKIEIGKEDVMKNGVTSFENKDFLDHLKSNSRSLETVSESITDKGDQRFMVFQTGQKENSLREHYKWLKAYIQSWTKALSEKPEMLMKAIRDAEKAANYLEYHAEILSKEEYQETLTLHENEETPTPGNTSEKMVEKTANPITREADLKANGYKLTPALKKHMDRLDQLTGRKNSVKDIYKAYKTHDFHGDPETEKTIKSIGKIFQRQEMQIKAVIPER